MPDIVIHATVAAGYLGLAWHFWSTRWRSAPSGTGASGLQAWERGAILVPFALHGWLLAQQLFGAGEVRFGFAQALSAMMWLGVAIYWFESLFYSLEGMEPLVLPLAGIAAPLPALFPGLVSRGAHVDAIEFRLHLALAMIAYSLFVIAMAHALLMAYAERRLHGRKSLALGRLPPLLTLERLLFRVIAAAFAFLTLTLLTGAVFSESVFGRAIRFDHKTVFAVLSWLTFGLLLGGRRLYGWRGRTALRWTLSGFVLLVLAYVGTRFVLEVVLGRS